MIKKIEGVFININFKRFACVLTQIVQKYVFFASFNLCVAVARQFKVRTY